MPWKETSPMHERHRFVLDAEYAACSFAELCRRYGISRKTGYKWWARYSTHGPATPTSNTQFNRNDERLARTNQRFL